jgi:hypothetical protein
LSAGLGRPTPLNPTGGGGIYQTVSPEAARRAMLLAAGKPVPPPHDLGGGIPGITPIARDWAQAAVGLPTGTAMIGKAFGLDAAGIARALVHGQAYGAPHLKALGQQGWQSTYQDIQHPLRHPGFTLLDLIPTLHAYAEIGKTGGVWTFCRS